MTRRRLMLAALVLVAVIAGAGVTFSRRASAAAGDIAAAGKTRVELAVVAAPRLAAPAIDVAAGITRSQRTDLAAPTPGSILRRQMGVGRAQVAQAQTTPMPRVTSVSGRIAVMRVRAGDRVKKGQLLAVLDDTMLKLALESAKAAERKANAQAGVLSATASDLRDTRADARAQGRAKLADGQAQLDAGRAQLDAGIAKIEAGLAKLPGLKAARAKAAAGLAGAEQGLAAARKALAEAENASHSATPPPGIEATIAKLRAQVKQLEATVAQLRATLAEIDKGIAGIEAGAAQLRKLKAARGQLSAAQGQLDAGREQLASALAKMSDAIGQLESGSDVARVFAGVPTAAVASAEGALAQATLLAPCDGVVRGAMDAGEVAMAGAPVVTIRPDGGTLVDAYLTAGQLAGIIPGSGAEVTLDAIPSALHGRVRSVSGEEQFAPSNYPTQIVHLSNVVRVTIEVPDDVPAGIPVDVVIHGHR